MNRIDWKPLIDLAVTVLYAVALFGTLGGIVWYLGHPIGLSVGIP